MRRFKVYDRRIEKWVDVDGVDALAKYLGVPRTDISPMRLFKVTYNDFTIVEKVN